MTVTAEETEHSAPDAAFFDLDNTLLHGASLYFIGRGMHAHGVVTRADLLRGAWQQLVFRLVGERRGHLASVRDRSLALGAGVEVVPLVALGEKIFDEFIADRILDDTLALARGHLDRGQDVFIVTAAPVELAQIVARRLGLTGALGTVSEVVEGRWTGQLVGDFLHGLAKAEAIRDLAGRRNYCLSRCAAYSDSINDLPMLQSVGDPHAVNPDRRLRAFATRQGWPIHDFRIGRRRAAVVAVGGSLTVGAAAVVLINRRRTRSAGHRATLAHALAFGAGARAGYLRAQRVIARSASQHLSVATRLHRSPQFAKKPGSERRAA